MGNIKQKFSYLYIYEYIRFLRFSYLCGLTNLIQEPSFTLPTALTNGTISLIEK